MHTLMMQTCALVVLGAHGCCSTVALNAYVMTACALVIIMGMRSCCCHCTGDLGTHGGGYTVLACVGGLSFMLAWASVTTEVIHV